MAQRPNTYDLSDEDLRRVLALRRQRAAITEELDRILGSASEVDRPTWGPCLRCGYTWKGLWRNKKPRHCASCHAPNWDKPKQGPAVRKKPSTISEMWSRSKVGGLTPPPVLSDPVTSAWSPQGTQPQPESFARPTLSTESESDASRSAPLANNPTPDTDTIAQEQLRSDRGPVQADQTVEEVFEQYAAEHGITNETEVTVEQMQANCNHAPHKIIDGICIGCGKEIDGNLVE